STGDKEDLGEDASKHGRRIHDIDSDKDITLVNDDNDMFDVGTLTGDEVLVEQVVAAKDVNLSVDEVTLAQALAAFENTATTTAIILTPRKGIVFQEPEPKKPIKKKELIRLDEEIASKLQAEFDKEVRLARKKAEKEEEANIVAWDNVVNTFVDMDTELVEGSEVRAEGSETRVEGSSKRAGEELEQESSKKQKLEEDKETTELQRLIEVVPDKEEVAIDVIPLATKPSSIVDYKIHKEGKKTYYKIIKADGSLKMYLVFSHMRKSFDMEDLETLWKLVKVKHGSTRPKEGYERVLLGDLKTMFDPHVEDQIMFDPHVEDQVWRNQQDYRVLDWKLYDSYGVHSLRKQNVHIHMLVEKRYPLTPATITDMLNRKLQANHWNEMCY
ncbi:hypothetical protein Tco_1441069, partial [Tanacetum coccineum]